MKRTASSLKCAVLRLNQGNLIFPVSLMAELVTYEDLEPSNTSIQGWLTWRNRRVPAVSLESLCMVDDDNSQSGDKYVILHTVSPVAGLPFIALHVQGGMQIVEIQEDNLRDDYSGNMERCPYVARQVRISKLLCLIPDLPAIEAAVAEVLDLNELDNQQNIDNESSHE